MPVASVNRPESRCMIIMSGLFTVATVSWTAAVPSRAPPHERRTAASQAAQAEEGPARGFHESPPKYSFRELASFMACIRLWMWSLE